MTTVRGRHAMFVGWVAGLAARNGLAVRPVLDDDGLYTDRFDVDVPMRGDITVTLAVIVPPPPDDWSLESD